MTKGLALTRIEHGKIVDKKNTVTVFQPGDAVDLPEEVFVTLEKGKAVRRDGEESPAPEPQP